MEDYPLFQPTSDERVLAILSHVLAIVPGIGIFGPLVIYLVKKGESGFVEANARESLNLPPPVLRPPSVRRLARFRPRHPQIQ